MNAQIARGFRLGGINDPLNVPLCTPQDLVTFGGRETWDDETAWNYEVGVKSRVLQGRGALNISGFYMDLSDLQATVTAGNVEEPVYLALLRNTEPFNLTGLPALEECTIWPLPMYMPTCETGL